MVIAIATQGQTIAMSNTVLKLITVIVETPSRSRCSPVLRSMYHQLRVREFEIRYSHYKFLLMSFGLKNHPSAFMDLMNRVFKQYLVMFVIVFIDKKFIYFRRENEHTDHLRIFLQVLKDLQLFAKFRKCEFLLRFVSFFNNIIFS